MGFVALAVGAAYTVHTVNKNAKKANATQQQAVAQAKVQAEQQSADITEQTAVLNRQNEVQAQKLEEGRNKADQRLPSVSDLVGRNARRAKRGQAGTMLTGTGGVNISTASLGKSTLLGS